MKVFFSSQISGLPLSGSDHMPLEELQVSEEPEESDEETGQSDCKIFMHFTGNYSAISL